LLGDKDNIKYKKSMWIYFDLIPLSNKLNIVSLNEGNTPIIRVKELEKYLNNCKFYVKNEGLNPTGTFKDREASYVISKAKELGLKRIVFHSTGNTGRAYMYYANKAKIETFFFLPLSCINKCDKFILTEKNHIIAIDGKFSQVSKIAKEFAKKNNIVAVASLQDKLEGKATIAYEQVKELPFATIFAQTIAGGYGIIGYELGFNRLKLKHLLAKDIKFPKIFAIQSSNEDTISKAINNGLNSITEEDLLISEKPFENTLQSTNPLKTYELVKECINKSNGIITSVNAKEVKEFKYIFEDALTKNNIICDYNNEKSPYICFSGLVKLAREKKICKTDIIYFILTGVGRKHNQTPKPEAILLPTVLGYDIINCSNYLKDYL